MHKHPKLTRKRIENFIEKRLAPNVYPDAVPLQLSACDLQHEPRPIQEALGEPHFKMPLDKKNHQVANTTR